jgi:hypothetical protein
MFVANLIDLLHNPTTSFGTDQITIGLIRDKLKAGQLGKDQTTLEASITKKLTQTPDADRIRMKVKPNAAASIAELLWPNIGTGAPMCVSYTYTPKGSPTSKSPDLATFQNILLMFENVATTANTFAEHPNQLADATYPYFSVEFKNKHVAATTEEAKQTATLRNGNVDSLLLADQATLFNAEIESCQALLAAVLARYRGKHDKYVQTNKKVKGIIVCSAKDYVKQNCTQSNAYTPQSYSDRMYYGIAEVATLGNGTRVVCSHYAPRKEVFETNSTSTTPVVKKGYKKVELTKFLSGNALLAVQGLGGNVEVYVTFATAV